MQSQNKVLSTKLPFLVDQLRSAIVHHPIATIVVMVHALTFGTVSLHISAASTQLMLKFIAEQNMQGWTAR